LAKQPPGGPLNADVHADVCDAGRIHAAVLHAAGWLPLHLMDEDDDDDDEDDDDDDDDDDDEDDYDEDDDDDDDDDEYENDEDDADAVLHAAGCQSNGLLRHGGSHCA
jgi:hypothetical protein